jgi:hypothetical protein
MGWTTWGVVLVWSILIVFAYVALVRGAPEERYRSDAELSERERQILDAAMKEVEATKESLF